MQYFNIANEALGYQGKDFYLELQYIIQNARNQKGDGKTIREALAIEIDKTIAKYLNATTITRWTEKVYGGIVYTAVMTPHHIAHLDKRDYTEKLFLYTNNALSKDVTIAGFVDAATGKLQGDFSKVPNLLYLNPDDILRKFTVEEAAAVIMHESGHIYVTAFYSGVMYCRSIALDWMYKELIGQSDAVKRKVIINRTRQMMGLKPADVVKELNQDGEKTFMVAATEITKELVDDDPLEMYSYPASEQMADAYAVRHGAGPALMTTRLRTVIQQRADSNMKTYPLLFAAGLFGISAVIVTSAAAVFALLFTLVCAKLGYDLVTVKQLPTTDQQFGHILSEMIQSLKQGKLPAEQKKELIEDIENAYALMEVSQKENFVLARSIYSVFDRLYHGRMQIQEFNEKLQSLATNRLFVDAAKMKMAR